MGPFYKGKMPTRYRPGALRAPECLGDDLEVLPSLLLLPLSLPPLPLPLPPLPFCSNHCHFAATTSILLPILPELNYRVFKLLGKPEHTDKVHLDKCGPRQEKIVNIIRKK